ncbi:hypothetical protein ScPMuIL_001329 [Solemya velum]
MSWGYDGPNGPAAWDNFKGAGVTGARQSPINIDSKDGTCGALNINYGTEPVQLENIGWTFKAKCGGGSISGGPLSGTYKLDSFHAHWGTAGSDGSEHHLNGKAFSAEMHIVNYNEKYGDFATAASKPDGLAIVAVFMQEGADNPALASVAAGMGSIASKGASGSGGSVDLTGLLPGNKSCHCYEGSLTTPPLTESVTWIVMDEPISVGKGQLDAFRSMKDGAGNALSKNHRPVVPKGGRQITCC